jgi:rhodanese-related sulfurtransferase
MLVSMLSRTGPSRISRPTLTGALLLAVVACAAITGSAPRPPWYQEVETIGIRLISARQLKGMLDRGESVLVIDARDEVHYRNGRVPGAISIPAEDAPLMAVDAHRPKRLLHPERLPADRAARLAFYCGGLT